MNNERDELAALVDDQFFHDSYYGDQLRSGRTRHTLTDAILAAGYTKAPAKVKGNTPRGLIRELFKHLDSWESQEHSTVGIAYLRRHFKDAA